MFRRILPTTTVSAVLLSTTARAFHFKDPQDSAQPVVFDNGVGAGSMKTGSMDEEGNFKPKMRNKETMDASDRNRAANEPSDEEKVEALQSGNPFKMMRALPWEQQVRSDIPSEAQLRRDLPSSQEARAAAGDIPKGGSDSGHIKKPSKPALR